MLVLSLMGDFGKIDIQKSVSYSHDLIEVLKNMKDANFLVQCFEGVTKLRSFCEAESFELQNLIEEYQKKINASRQRIEEAKGEIVNDDDVDSLENELDEEIQKKHSLLEELSVVNEQISVLEHQRLSVEDRKQNLIKCEKDESRFGRKLSAELSSYASITKVVPDVNDKTKISGHIVEKSKSLVEKFEFEPSEASVAEICNSLWRMIDE